MQLQPLSAATVPDYLALEFPTLDAQERAARIAKISQRLETGLVQAEQFLLLTDNNIVCGLVRWRIQNGQLETFGSPFIQAGSRNQQALRTITKKLLELAKKHTLSLRLTFDQRQIGRLPEHFASTHGLRLTFHSQTYQLDLEALEQPHSTLRLETIETTNIEQAAAILHNIQSDSFDPTAAEDTLEPLATLQDRFEQGRQLEQRGGAAQNYLVYQQQKIVGLLLVRLTHPVEKRGGLFLGILPEQRQQGLGREIHRLGLQALSNLGARQYWGETFVGNLPMQRIFAANGCALLEQGNYWEFSTLEPPRK